MSPRGTTGWPAASASFAVVAVGAFLAFAGMREIFEHVMRGAPADASALGGVAASRASVRVALVISRAAFFVAGIAYMGRPAGQGGRFRGSEDERKALLMQAFDDVAARLGAVVHGHL